MLAYFLAQDKNKWDKKLNNISKAKKRTLNSREYSCTIAFLVFCRKKSKKVEFFPKEFRLLCISVKERRKRTKKPCYFKKPFTSNILDILVGSKLRIGFKVIRNKKKSDIYNL